MLRLLKGSAGINIHLREIDTIPFGSDIITTLCIKFGFMIKRQEGSHVLLVKESKSGKTGCVVPLHIEVKIGTLKAILEHACIPEKEYSHYQ